MNRTARTNRNRRLRPRHRRGVTLMLSLLVISLLIVIAIVLFDWTRMALVQQQLQATADSAALAGAQRLANLGLELPAQSANADANARIWQAQYETAQAQAAAVVRETDADLAKLGSEIIVGHRGDAEVEPFAGLAACDVVEVKLGRTAAQGNPLEMITARMFGLALGDVQVRSRAQVQRSISGFRPTATKSVPCLPVVVQDTASPSSWQNQLAAAANGAFNDHYARTLTGESVPGEDGVPEIAVRLQLSGSSENAASGWLTNLSAGGQTASVLPAAWAQQLATGLTAADLAATDGELVASATQRYPVLVSDQVDPAAVCELVQSIVGQRRIVPLGRHDAQTNSLKINGFAAGTVVDCYLDDDQSLVVIIQPGALETATAVVDATAPPNPWLGKVVLAD